MQHLGILPRVRQRLLSTSAGPSLNEVRRSFLDFFTERGHVHVPSSSVVPAADGSLLFTNAGMVQFKSILNGDVAPEFNRVVNWQRCIRAGGKHNDLDEVGRDHHHHSFFEMLGNWSFNKAYFKKEACEFAWEFLTSTVKIAPERIYVTYFGGSDQLGLGPDNECRRIWRSIGVPEDRIIPFAKENFWEMADTGPCGPCTELHVDRRAERKDATNLVNRGDDSLVEVWNLVFITYNRTNGELVELPSVHVDTGMGLERLTSILQNVPSNYDTDAFQPTFRFIESLGGPKYTASSSSNDISLRIVADHTRAFCVALADGVKPAARGRGFVLRKLLRRTFHHLGNLGLPHNSAGALVEVPLRFLIAAYPPFAEAQELVREETVREEQLYWDLMKRGRKLYFDFRSKLAEDCQVFPGDAAWQLHSAYGIPIEVVENLSSADGLHVDMDTFNNLLR